MSFLNHPIIESAVLQFFAVAHSECRCYKDLSPKGGALLPVSLLLRRSKAFALLNYFVFLGVLHKTLTRLSVM